MSKTRIEEYAERFVKIREWTHKAAEQAIGNGDNEALLVYRITMPSVTAEQAKEQRERLQSQVLCQSKPKLPKCPVCHGEVELAGEHKFQCFHCGHVFPETCSCGSTHFDEKGDCARCGL